MENEPPSTTRADNKEGVNEAYSFILDQAQPGLPLAAQKRRKRILLTGSVAVVLLCLTFGLWWAFFRGGNDTVSVDSPTQATTASQYTSLIAFEDPRFRIDVPGIWLVSPGYTPGDGPVFFSGPATHELELYGESRETVTLTVYAYESSTYIDNTSDDLYELIERDSYERGGVEYEFSVFKVADGVNDDEDLSRIMVRNSAERANRELVAEVRVPAGAWGHYRELVKKSLRSLELM